MARGDPPPEISWKREKGTLPLKRVHFDEERFLISNVSLADNDIYTCVAENKAGSVSSSAYVTVLGECFYPSIFLPKELYNFTQCIFVQASQLFC